MELYPEGGIKDTTLHFPAVGYDKHDNVGVCELVSYKTQPQMFLSMRTRDDDQVSIVLVPRIRATAAVVIWIRHSML